MTFYGEYGTEVHRHECLARAGKCGGKRYYRRTTGLLWTVCHHTKIRAEHTECLVYYIQILLSDNYTLSYVFMWTYFICD